MCVDGFNEGSPQFHKSVFLTFCDINRAALRGGGGRCHQAAASSFFFTSSGIC